MSADYRLNRGQLYEAMVHNFLKQDFDLNIFGPRSISEATDYTYF